MRDADARHVRRAARGPKAAPELDHDAPVRRRFLQQFGAVATTGALVTSARAQSSPEIRWRLRSGVPRNLDLVHASLDALADELAAATAGRFRLQRSSAEDAASGAQLFDAVREGAIEVAHAEASALVDRSPAFALFGAMPFGMTARQQEAWLRYGGGLSQLNGAFKRHDIIAHPVGDAGLHMGGWYRREVKTAADLKGLRVRAGGFNAAVWARLGAVPQRLSDRDVRAALEAGRIDGAVCGGPYDDEKQGLFKVARYYCFPLGPGDGGPLLLLVNLAAWSALPRGFQAAFAAACTAAGVDLRARYDAANTRAMRALLANGVQLRPFPHEVSRAGFQAADDLYAETVRNDETFGQIYPAWRAFRDDQIRTFGLADARTQGFMYTAIVAPAAVPRR